MPQDIAPIVAVAQNPSATAAEIDAALPLARTAASEATAALDAAARAYDDGLIGLDDKTLGRLAAERSNTKIRADRTGALVARLEASLTEAQSRERETARSAIYAAALAQRDAAAARFAEEYPPLVGTILDLMRALVEADAAVEAANADLPVGAERLLGAETVARMIPGQPREVIADVEVPLWCEDGAAEPLPEDRQHLVTKLADGRGRLQTPAGNHHDYVRRVFRRVSFRPAVLPAIPSPLAATLALPALRVGDPIEWLPASIGGEAPSAGQMLARLEGILEAAGLPPAAPTRGVAVEFVAVETPGLNRRNGEHVEDWRDRLGPNMGRLFTPIDAEVTP